MLKITANSAEAFNEIEAALNEFDEKEVFLRYFDTAVQSETDVEGTTIILRNNKKFKKDLNKKKYIISIPTTLTIDAFEHVKKFETRGGKRVPFYSVLVKGHLATSNVNIILILVGFNSDEIRVMSYDEILPEEDFNENTGNNCGGLKPVTNHDMYCMYHQPRPLGGLDPNCHDKMNYDENDFVLDTTVAN